MTSANTPKSFRTLAPMNHVLLLEISFGVEINTDTVFQIIKYTDELYQCALLT